MNIQKTIAATIFGIALSAGSVMAQSTTPAPPAAAPQTQVPSVDPNTNTPMPTNYDQNGSTYEKAGTIDGKSADEVKQERATTPSTVKPKSIYEQNGSTYVPNGTLDRSAGTICCQDGTPR